MDDRAPGQICKVCNQVAIGGALAGVSEAFALAKKAGVDAARVRQALLGGFAASRVLEVHGERMLVDNYKPGFRARLYQKDLRIAYEAAAANAVAMPATAIVTQLINALVASGGADLDYAAIGTVLFDEANAIKRYPFRCSADLPVRSRIRPEKWVIVPAGLKAHRTASENALNRPLRRSSRGRSSAMASDAG